MNPNKKECAYFIIGWILSICLELLLFNSLELLLSFNTLLLLHFLIWSISYGIIRSPKRVFPPLIALGLFVMSLNFSYIKNQSTSFFYWGYDFINGLTDSIPNNYVLLFFIGITLFNCLGLAWLLKGHRRKIIIPILSILFIVQWLRYIEQAFIYFEIYFFGMAVLYIHEMYYLSIRNKLTGEKNGSLFSEKKYLFHGILLTLIMILIANFMSKEIKPIEFDGINILSSRAGWRNGFDQININNRFDLSETPFQTGGKLGGPVQSDQSLIMLVKAEDKLYLRGTIKDYYTGTNWISTDDRFKEIRDGVIKGDQLVGGYKKVRVEIIPASKFTSTIFSPFQPISIESTYSKISYNSNFELYFKGSMLTFRAKNYTVISHIPIISLDNLTNDAFPSISGMEEYLQLPKAVPHRVRQLALEITQQNNSAYNKMKDIEKYLRSQYTYSLNVKNVPKNRDFVDWFLFEEEEGYCTYFASAMAILGRSIGIPTRYVEGYLLPNERNADGLYEVHGNRAHAWVEAYVDGMGWLSLEPTPVYESTQATLINKYTTMEFEAVLESSVESARNNIISKEYLEHKYMMEENNTTTNSIKTSKAFLIWILVLVLIVIAILLRIIYCSIKNSLGKLTNNREIIRNYFYKIHKIICHLERAEQHAYTPREIMFHEKKDCVNVYNNEDNIVIIEKALYGNEDLSDGELERIKKLKEFMELKAQQKMGLGRFYFYRYIKGSI